MFPFVQPEVSSSAPRRSQGSTQLNRNPSTGYCVVESWSVVARIMSATQADIIYVGAKRGYPGCTPPNGRSRNESVFFWKERAASTTPAPQPPHDNARRAHADLTLPAAMHSPAVAAERPPDRYVVRPAGVLAELLGAAELVEDELLLRLRELGLPVAAARGAAGETARGPCGGGAAAGWTHGSRRTCAGWSTVAGGGGGLRPAALGEERGGAAPDQGVLRVRPAAGLGRGQRETVQVCFLRLYYVGLCACVQLH